MSQINNTDQKRAFIKGLEKIIKGIFNGFEEFANTGFRYIDIPGEQKTGRPKNKISGKMVRTGIFVVRPAGLTFVPGGAC